MAAYWQPDARGPDYKDIMASKPKTQLRANVLSAYDDQIRMRLLPPQSTKSNWIDSRTLRVIVISNLYTIWFAQRIELELELELEVMYVRSSRRTHQSIEHLIYQALKVTLRM